MVVIVTDTRSLPEVAPKKASPAKSPTDSLLSQDAATEFAYLENDSRVKEIRRLQQEVEGTIELARKKLNHIGNRINELASSIDKAGFFDWAFGTKEELKKNLEASETFHQAQDEHHRGLKESLLSSKKSLERGMTLEHQGKLLEEKERLSEAQLKYNEAQESFKKAINQVSNQFFVERKASERYIANLDSAVDAYEESIGYLEKAATTAKIVRNTTVITDFHESNSP